MKNFMLIILGSLVISSCLTKKPNRETVSSNIINLNDLNQTKLSHYKNNNFIISINKKNNQRLKTIGNKDSLELTKDTVNLQLVDPFWTKQKINRTLRECFESNQVKVYSIKNSKEVYKIKRVVSKNQIKGIHNYYAYTIPNTKDTILYSYSFDTGTPPF